ncbi:membrane protein YpdK [Escherichia coli]
MSVGSTHHLEMVFVWKQNYILVDEYFFFCCTWIVNSAGISFMVIVWAGTFALMI